jgi:hypothetical protein
MRSLVQLRIGLALAAVLCVLAHATPAARSVDQRTSRGESAATTPTLEAARQRWERLTPEEKVRARERYEKYLSLSESERAELAERAQRLKESSARVQRELSPEQREKLSTLEPEKRHELIGELVEGEAKEKGQRIREMLPDNVLKRLEAARPEDRARYLNDFKIKQRRRVARYAIDQFGKRLALPAEEVERLKNLPEDDRAQAVLELRKQLNEQEAAAFGLPPGISQREWDAWEKLSPEEFFEVMQRYQHMRAAHAAVADPTRDAATPTTGGKPAVEPPANGDKPAVETRNGVPTNGAPTSGSMDSKSTSRDPGHSQGVAAETAREESRPSPAKLQALHELSEARRVRPSDLLDLAHLSKSERALRIDHGRRERCLAAIRKGSLLPAERIEQLAKAPDPVFFETVRRILGAGNPAARRNGSESPAPATPSRATPTPAAPNRAPQPKSDDER